MEIHNLDSFCEKQKITPLSLSDLARLKPSSKPVIGQYFRLMDIEFKNTIEENKNGSIFFTHTDAMEAYAEPDEHGWRLPTKDELEYLCEQEYSFMDGCAVFAKTFVLAAFGYATKNNRVYGSSSLGFYWTSTYDVVGKSAYVFHFNEHDCFTEISTLDSRYCVRLVRTIL